MERVNPDFIFEFLSSMASKHCWKPSAFRADTFCVPTTIFPGRQSPAVMTLCCPVSQSIREEMTKSLNHHASHQAWLHQMPLHHAMRISMRQHTHYFRAPPSQRWTKRKERFIQRWRFLAVRVRVSGLLGK